MIDAAFVRAALRSFMACWFATRHQNSSPYVGRAGVVRVLGTHRRDRAERDHLRRVVSIPSEERSSTRTLFYNFEIDEVF